MRAQDMNGDPGFGGRRRRGYDKDAVRSNNGLFGASKLKISWRGKWRELTGDTVNTASGQLHLRLSDKKVPSSYHRAVTIQNNLSTLTSRRLLKAVAMYKYVMESGT